MNDLDKWEDDFDVSILEDEVNKIKDEVDNKCEKEIEKNTPRKEVRIITEQTEILKIKWLWIFFWLLSKLGYKLFFLWIFYLALKIEILRNYILNFYFAHYLFFFMFVLLTIDLILFLIHFMSDVQDILMDNIYIQTVVKQKEEKIAV